MRVGDYGLSHNNYRVRAWGRGSSWFHGGLLPSANPAPSCFQEDYYITPDRLWIPLRWVAPELLDETHGTLMVVDQSKESNVW